MSQPDAKATQDEPVGGRIDWRPVILAATLWVGMWACTCAIPILMLITGSIGALIALIASRKRQRFAIAIGFVLLACLPMAGLRMWFAKENPIYNLANESAVVTISARVGPGKTGTSSISAWWGAPANVETVSDGVRKWKTNARIWLISSGDHLGAWQSIPPGTLVSAIVRLAPSDRGDASYLAMARAREPPEILASPSLVDITVERLHQGLRNSVAHLAQDPRALVPALVVGDTLAMSDELREQFVATGLTHLTAVSGANLTIILACLMFVAARVGVRGWWLRGIAVVGVLFFVVLCRGEPSVLRAAAMGSVGLLALGWASPRQGMRYLSTAVIVLLLIDPQMSHSVGFSLSVAATAGIILWANSWAAKLSKWVPLWLAEALCVPLSAQLATQPIVTWISAQVSLVSVAANLVAGPLVAPATVMGCVAIVLSQIWMPLATIPATIAGWFAYGLCWIAGVGASFPGAAYTWPTNEIGMLAIIGLSVGLLLVFSSKRGIRVLIPTMCLLLVLSCFSPPSPPGWPPKDWRIVSCDVGQGDATVLNAGDGSAVVVDTGPDPKKLASCLSGLGIRSIPLLILTHLHADHISGISALRQGRDLSRILYSGIQSPQSGWREVLENTSGLPHDVVSPGTRLQIGAVRIEILTTMPLPEIQADTQGDSPDENNSSLVIRATVGELSILLCGDLEEVGQLEASLAPDLRADIMLIPHHGSSHQNVELWRRIGASIALNSVGVGNSYGHPAASTLRLAHSLGMRVFRTDINGSIAISIADSSLRVTVERKE